MPAFIDHILEVTGQEQLTYVGHSQGTTQVFMGASLLPEYYTAKINLMVGLGPVADTSRNAVPVLRLIASLWRELQVIILREDLFDLYNSNWWQEEAEKVLCAEIDPELCVGLLKYFGNADPEVDNLERLNVFLKDFPSGQGYQGLAYYG